MKKQIQTKKRQNRSRSKKQTRSKKHNKKSIKIGGSSSNIVDQPPLLRNNIYDIRVNVSNVLLGSYRLTEIMASNPNEVIYTFRRMNDNDLLEISGHAVQNYKFTRLVDRYNN